MAAPRLNTVFDYTSLRLQKSGGRLVRVKQSATNLDLPTSRSTIQDSRGNWIARDAVGFQSVYKSKPTNQGDENSEEAEVIDPNLEPEAEDAAEDADGDDNIDNGQSQRRKARAKDGGAARKRRKIVQDLDFLEVSPDNVDSPSTLPLPSSDLLKCIHHFASNYYNERGQLLNSTRDYRRNRKARQLAKLHSKTQDKTGGEAQRLEKGDAEEVEDDEDDDEEEEDPSPPRKRVRYSREKYMFRDMYKIMDGSSLMAIGMLLQEHVAQLLTPKIPEGWEEAMILAQDEDEEIADEELAQSDSSDLVDQNEVPPSTDASQFGAESTEDDDSEPEIQIDETEDEDEGMDVLS